MKPISLVLILAAWLGLAFNLHATITVSNYWRMGENDPGAVAGGRITNTVDAVQGAVITNFPNILFGYPYYTTNVAATAAAEAVSDLSAEYTTEAYGVGSVISGLTNNFGIECWVDPVYTNAGAVVVYNGNTGSSGWGLYQSGTNILGFFGGEGFFESTPIPTNAWTHVALVRNGGTNILYVNGVAAGTSTLKPASPAGNFLVAADNGGVENYLGLVDEVRVFTFAPGQFSPTNLLVNQPLVVTTAADSGAGSLRGAVAVATAGNSTITFTDTLSGQTITLASTLQINTNLTIDASALPGGIQIDGRGNSTVFNIVPGVTAVLNSLTITNGINKSGYGGGISNFLGTLTLNECTLSGNGAVDYGGGIFNYEGTLVLNECSLSGNSGYAGGGIYNIGTMTLNECTMSGNTAQAGGGIYNNGTLTLNGCTLSANLANVAGEGGGIYNDGGDGIASDGGQAFLVLANTIVAGNVRADIDGTGFINFHGSNLVELEADSGATVSGPAPLSGAPDLAVLGNYGGPTQTMPPLPGSPAVNAGSVAANTFTNDQRGYPRLIASQIDIGAVEGLYSLNASVLTGATWLGNGSFQFGFTNYEDMTFNVFATTNLALPFNLWLNLGYPTGAPAGSGRFQFTDTGATNSPQRFYRVVSP